jgi:hypothetical protein
MNYYVKMVIFQFAKRFVYQAGYPSENSWNAGNWEIPNQIDRNGGFSWENHRSGGLSIAIEVIMVMG